MPLVVLSLKWTTAKKCVKTVKLHSTCFYNYSNNLKIMGLMASDTGIFQCVAVNDAGNIQASASLKVVELGNGNILNSLYVYVEAYYFYLLLSMRILAIYNTITILRIDWNFASRTNHKIQSACLVDYFNLCMKNYFLFNYVEMCFHIVYYIFLLFHSILIFFCLFLLSLLTNRFIKSFFNPSLMHDPSYRLCCAWNFAWADKERNKTKNRKKKYNTNNQKDEAIPFPEQQSRKLFTQLKSESANTNKNINPNQTSPYPNYDPHHILTSLRSSEAGDNNLGDTLSAYTESSPFSKHFTAEDYLDSRPMESVPGAPQDLKAPVVQPRFVILSWRPPDFNYEDIIAYSVYYRQENNKR